MIRRGLSNAPEPHTVVVVQSWAESHALVEMASSPLTTVDLLSHSETVFRVRVGARGGEWG